MFVGASVLPRAQAADIVSNAIEDSIRTEEEVGFDELMSELPFLLALFVAKPVIGLFPLYSPV
jgi:hypothetical protein